MLLVRILVESSVLINVLIIIVVMFFVLTFIDLRTNFTSHMSVHNIFKNGSSVEFCYGTNINVVYIRSYDQKKKYSKEMKQFYAYYKISKTI